MRRNMMTPKSITGSYLYKVMLTVAFCVTLLLPQQLEARVLAGSVTERKINRKIASMLKAARRNYDNGKVQVALDNYWKILEIDPQETFAYLELGEIYVELRIYDRAIELLEPGLTMAQREMDKDTICYYFCILTTAHLALNQTGQANKTLIKAAEAAPKNPMPRKILGDIYLANNRIADAIKAYKKALEFDPDYQPAREKLGEVVAKYGERPQEEKVDRRELAKKAEPLPPVKTPATRPAAATPATRPQPAKADSQQTAAVPANPAPVSTEVAGEPEDEEDAQADLEEDNEDGEEFEEVSSSDESGAIPDDMTPLPLPAQTAKTPSTQPATTSTPRPTPTGQPAPAQPVPTETAQPAATTPSPASTDAVPQTAAAAPPTASVGEINDQLDKLLAGSPEEKKAATSFFLKLEDKGLTEVEELLYDPDPEARIIGIRTVVEFKAYKQRVKTMLEDAMEDPDPTVIEEIEKALAQLQ